LAKNEQKAVATSIGLGVVLLVASWLPDLWKFLHEGLSTGVANGTAKTDLHQWVSLHWQEKSRAAANFLFSASALMAVVLAYLRQSGAHLDDLRVRFFFRNHTIICGMSTRSKLLAKDLAGKGKSVVIVNLDEKHEDTSEVRIQGVSVLQGDAKNPEVLKQAGFRHAINLVAMTDSDETNLAILEIARATLDSMKEAGGVAREMSCFCHIRSPNLRSHLEQLAFMGPKVEGVRFRLFNIEEITAAELLRRYPPERRVPLDQQAEGVHVALFGGGDFALALAIQMAQICHYWRADYLAEALPRTRLTIVSTDAESILAQLRQMCAAIDLLLDLRAVPLAPENPAACAMLFEGGPVSQVYVALSEEVSCLAVASELTRLLGKTADSDRASVVAIMPARIHRIDPKAWNRNGAVEVFESYESCNDDVVIGGARDKMAETAHSEYLKNALKNGKKIGDRPALYEWSRLSEFLRASNRQQIAHMDVKLRVLGWEINREPKADLPVASPEISPEQMEQLADMEHRRWMAFYYVHGWVQANVRNDDAREHDCLIPYCQLSEELKGYDRDTVRGMGALCVAAGYALRRCEASS
jgi:hypothetical protein